MIKSLYKEGGLRSIFKGSAATAARGRSFSLFCDFSVISDKCPSDNVET